MAEQPLRYGKLPEIHHVFRPDPKNPPVILSIVFLAAVLGTLPVLAGVVRAQPRLVPNVQTTLIFCNV